MNKHGGIIEIRGLKGLFTAIFIVCCLITGFTVFPGFIAMNIWNLITPYITDMPHMNLIQGVLLWAIVFTLWFSFNGKMPTLNFCCERRMDEKEIQEFVSKIKEEQKKLEEEKNTNENSFENKGKN
jgi:hypothetical protein